MTVGKPRIGCNGALGLGIIKITCAFFEGIHQGFCLNVISDIHGFDQGITIPYILQNLATLIGRYCLHDRQKLTNRICF